MGGRIWLIISVFLLALGCTAAAGRTIYVDDDGPAEFDNIQAAINDSNDGDTIIVQPGLYTEYVRFLGKNITLTSTNPVDSNVVAATIIRWGAGFLGTEDPNCMLTGFRIKGYIYGGVNHTHATISHCLLSGNRVPRGTVIKNCDGIIRNCVVTDNWPNSDWLGPTISGCHGLIKNCTITHNCYGGITVLNGGITTIENCIIYNNYDGIRVKNGATLNILYSNVDYVYSERDGIVNWGPGNIDTDPCFVRVKDWYGELDGDYHLKSQAGRLDPNTQKWVKDNVTSPCIDAGNPHCPIGLEPFPNDGRVNMGAYGGTAEASKSYFGEPVCETIVAGDINGDCKVNFKDFALMAFHWLKAEPYLLNRPPMVNITNPENGAVFYTNETIEVEADASDIDGMVVNVEFFANEDKIGEDNNSTDGWRTNWRGHAAGTYSLTAKATDNDGATTTSPAVEITVKSGGGPPP